MARKRKQDIRINNSESLEGLMQEIYNDACSQIIEANNAIVELTTSTVVEDVDDSTKIAREKANLIKMKDSGIKIKLEVAKLQSDIIKNNGSIEETNNSRIASGAPSLDDFKEIRNMVSDMHNTEKK